MASGPGWDLSRFQVEEIYRVAVSVEQGGFDFYNRIVETSDNSRVKNEMRFLRDEEARHKAFFQRQLAAKGAAEAGTVSPDLQKLLESEFLHPMEELYRSRRIEKNTEALRFGMDIEQKTVDFYTALRERQTDQAFREDLDLVIDEERKHKQKINILLAY